MKKQLPAIVTILLIVAALAYFTQRQRLAQLTADSPAAATPEAVIWRMADAARTGDAAAYLDCFSGELQAKLRKTAAELGDAQFRQYLQRLHSEVTGLAVSDLVQPRADEAALRVEFVLRDHNEAQQHHFKLIGGVWKIDRIEGTERVNPLIPFGTSDSQTP